MHCNSQHSVSSILKPLLASGLHIKRDRLAREGLANDLERKSKRCKILALIKALKVLTLGTTSLLLHFFEGLPGLALAACPWALGRAPSVPGGGRRVRSLSPKDRANVTSATLHQWPIPASYHPNPHIFYWDIVGGNGWYGYHGVHECPIESLAGTHPSSSS